jgi:hypothetical protein
MFAFIIFCSVGAALRADPKTFSLVREAIRRGHLSGRTEESYVSWIKHYNTAGTIRHP